VSAVRLVDWSTHPIYLPYPRHIQWGHTDEDGAYYVLLRLVTDDGLVGVTEAAAKPAWQSVNARTLMVIIEELFIPLIRNVDLLDERAVNRALGQIREQRTARSVVETAC